MNFRRLEIVSIIDQISLEDSYSDISDEARGGIGGINPPLETSNTGGEYRLITCRKPKSNFFVWRSCPQKKFLAACLSDINVFLILTSVLLKTLYLKASYSWILLV
jgi:hypothetical protein